MLAYKPSFELQKQVSKLTIQLNTHVTLIALKQNDKTRTFHLFSIFFSFVLTVRASSNMCEWVLLRCWLFQSCDSNSL